MKSLLFSVFCALFLFSCQKKDILLPSAVTMFFDTQKASEDVKLVAEYLESNKNFPVADFQKKHGTPIWEKTMNGKYLMYIPLLKNEQVQSFIAVFNEPTGKYS